MPRFETALHFPDAEATAAFGRRLASLLAPGDVVLLSGPIGAGKSHLARACIAARLEVEGRVEDIPSPTFTLVQVYEVAGCEIWHADLYRLTHSDELVELGLEDAFASAICLIEWPDRLGDLAPAGALSIALSAAPDDSRTARLSSDDPRWAARLDGGTP
ncbi:tRNA (adenosine(37)-N6)-threonylcarbamoyltransferase complex ATPase subunit type 1 TsaE [Phaeovulum vinaykumarii]|uniref:tRNA threonylcarbamoyladenosine biosynthesis protein TsaE n=1 Tax=Phaeovulum vinaykumarii TaxID=407234 RepID=A0A1N7K9I1_9RHOB|nr:tRNA (adenosine(37)-N6)-threonylcarbamoyltransferase complex ATPase subunit type 1 TsaE [Phaeovulum vinaykumarii]SIS58190.1 tRNA threonylcarbamoyladenosine biosynthesis protein TsaE [Phaeovulum vinaykumarii]SOB93712.1 tRNA threonylcarbamoyladenosine biosynthesis protein TsaE [Phaeovulum vinaykumarii]